MPPGAEDVGSSGGAGAPSWMPNPRLNPFMPAVHESWESDGSGAAGAAHTADRIPAVTLLPAVARGACLKTVDVRASVRTVVLGV